MKQSLKLNERNAEEIERHAIKNRRSFNSQGNISVEDWLEQNRAELLKGPKLDGKTGRGRK